MAASVIDIIQHIREHQNAALYQDLHWEGTFPDYLQLVRDQPLLARNSFQRLYDMITSYSRWNALRATEGFSRTRAR